MPGTKFKWLAFFLFVLLAAVFLGIAVGAVSLWPLGTKTSNLILWQIRFPRIILGLLVGLMLATSGTILQGVLRNPLADPYILGVSAGAGMGTAVGLTFQTGIYWVPLFAFF